MESRKKLGWTEKGIVGWIFMPIGLFFLFLGILLWYYRAGSRPGDSVIFLSVFGGIGFFFALIGFGLLWLDLRRRAGMRRAIDGGNYVMAKVTGVREKTNINFNGTHPWVVECQVQDASGGTVHVYYSRHLRINPSEFVSGREVPVYISRDNPDDAYVDIDAILPEIVVHP